MQTRLILLILMCFSVQVWASPPDTLRLDSLFSIVGQTGCIGLDAFKNLYVTQPNGALVQYDSMGAVRPYRYSNNRLGAPDALDVSNPLKTILFYKNYQSIVLLDRTLTETGVLELSDAGLGWVSAVCSAQDGQFWIYDQVDFSLKKINQKGQSLYKSQNLNNFLQRPVVLEHIYVASGRVYAWDADFFYVFDNFGQYQKHLPLKGLRSVLATKSGFLCVLKGEIVQFDAFFIEIHRWQLAEQPTNTVERTVFIKEKRLVQQSETELTAFSW